MLPFGRQDLTLFLFARKGAFHSVKQFSFFSSPCRPGVPLVFQLRPESVRILAPAADADLCSFGKVALG